VAILLVISPYHDYQGHSKSFAVRCIRLKNSLESAKHTSTVPASLSMYWMWCCCNLWGTGSLF